MKNYSIAIDGPSGAGKSTLAKALARKIGFMYVDTGAIYRTIGYYAFSHGISLDDISSVVSKLPDIKIDINYDNEGLQHMLLNGEDVTDQIRINEISMYASKVSALPEVRELLLELQRDFARNHSVIMDGRDIGTVVLPNADVKLFLNASVEIRARRREAELKERGTPVAYEKILKDIEERDYADSHREIAPLRAAEDAIKYDTGPLTFAENLDKIAQIIYEKIKQ